MHALEGRSPIRSFSADLSVTKVCKPDQAVAVGQRAICTIMIRNLGPDEAFKVAIIDKLASSGTFVIGAVGTNKGSCTASTHLEQGGTVTCSAPSIASDATVTIMVPVTAKMPEDINDIVTVSGQPFDPIPNNNSASGVVHVVPP
jgi:uncharacterized repeat protein (TIGR01451 family)